LDEVSVELKSWWLCSGFSCKLVRPGHPRPYRRGRTGGLQTRPTESSGRIANWPGHFLQPLIFFSFFLDKKRKKID
jgi:hypothetical protein